MEIKQQELININLVNKDLNENTDISVNQITQKVDENSKKENENWNLKKNQNTSCLVF
jgi:hypothetical protein